MYIDGGHLHLVWAKWYDAFIENLINMQRSNLLSYSTLSHKYSSTFWIIKQIPLGEIQAYAVKFSMHPKFCFGVCCHKDLVSLPQNVTDLSPTFKKLLSKIGCLFFFLSQTLKI